MSQALTEWDGDVASLITEMKRRIAVSTDQELARAMGLGQSTVSNWRKRGAVPQSSLLQFERMVEDADGLSFKRSLAARCIAMRLPELWYQSIKDKHTGGRYLWYAGIAYNLNAIVAEIARQMERLENTHKMPIDELARILIEDENFLNGVIKWVADMPMSDMLALELAANERHRRT